MKQISQRRVHLTVENIGGIEQTAVEFGSGVTVLSGRNATNRTSLLQAVMAGLGSDRVSLKGDADSGAVTLQIGEETYTRTLERQGDDVVFDGDPYLEDAELADLFAFLLESNEARRTVARGDDLRDIIMEPVDVDEIQADIRRLQSEKSEITAEIEDRESLRRKLPELEQRRSEIVDEIEEVQATLAERREALDQLSRDAEEARDEQSKLQTKMDTLQERRAELEDTEFRLASQHESLESLRTEREDLQAQYDDLDDDLQDIDSISSEMSRLRGEKQRLDSEMSRLQSIIQFNEEMLEGTNEDIAAALRDEAADEAVTDQLLEDTDSVVCWTCGTEVEQERIEGSLERLRELRQSKHSERASVDEQLSSLKETQSNIESRRSQRRNIERRLEDIETEIEERESKIDGLEASCEELSDGISDLEAEIESLESDDRSDVLTVQREVSELEVELDRLENERERIETNIEDLEAETDAIEDLEREKEQIQEQLTDRRTRIERIEREAVETFNEQMDTVLEILDYDNIDRIWVERVEREVREGRQKVTEPVLHLHIVRSTDDGVTYEDEFQHLSESEREVTSLVFALAGYLAHDVHEVVPFMLLDSLEAIDSERIAALVEYIAEYAESLLVALLPEDASALSDEYRTLTDI